MKLKQQAGKALIGWLAFGLLCTLVQPTSLPIIMLIIPFVLLYFAVYSTWLVVALLWRWASGDRAEPPRRKQLAAAASGFMVLVVIMGSLGQLKIRDVLTLGLIFGIAYFYLVRWRSKEQNLG